MIISTSQFKQLLAEYTKIDESEVSAFVDAFVLEISERLRQSESVSVQGLGTFEIVDSQQGALRRVAFRPDSVMKEQVNAPFSCFEPFVVTPAKPVADAFDEEAEEKTSIDPSNAYIGPDILPTENPSLEAEEALGNAGKNTKERDNHPMRKEQKPATSGWLIWHYFLLILSLSLAGVLLYCWLVLHVNNPLPPQVSMPTVNTVEESQEAEKLDFESKKTVPLKKHSETISKELDAALQKVENCPSQNSELLQKESAISQEKIANPLTSSTTLQKQETVKNNQLELAKKNQPESAPSEPSEYSEPLPEQLMPDTSFTLQPGERLTLVAERVYGNKIFWGYIFEVNAHKMKNPNNVPPRVRYNLPSAKYYQIDASDEQSLRRARKKVHEIQEKFRAKKQPK